MHTRRVTVTGTGLLLIDDAIMPTPIETLTAATSPILTSAAVSGLSDGLAFRTSENLGRNTKNDEIDCPITNVAGPKICASIISSCDNVTRLRRNDYGTSVSIACFTS